MRRQSFNSTMAGVALCVLAMLLPAWNASAQSPQGHKKRVAVMDFDYATVQSNAAAIFGTDVDVGRGIADLLVNDLVNNGTYSVIERQRLNTILAEQNFSNSDRADPSTAAKIGKLLGVDAIIIGAVTQFGDETKSTNIGGGFGLGGFGVGGFGHKKSKAIVGLSARIVNVNTGEIMAVAEGKGQSSRSSTSLLGGGGNWHGFGNGSVDFGSSDFEQTIIGEAIKTATDKLSAELIADSSKVTARQVSAAGLVAAIVNGQVILNIGSKAGVQVGDELKIERITQVIRDPATGKVLRQLTTQLGVVKAVNVDAVSAVCTIVSGSGFKVGDIAQLGSGELPVMEHAGGGHAVSFRRTAARSENRVASSRAASHASGNGAASGAAASAGSTQPNLVATKIDFIPGEKTIFEDNFHDMPPGEPPPHWKVRGGAVELRMGGGVRQLTLPNPSGGTELTSQPFNAPKNFTFETTMMNQCAAEWDLQDKGGNDQLEIDLAPPPDGRGHMAVDLGPNSLGSATATLDGKSPFKLALWAQEGRVRLYINGHRLIDINQVKLAAPVAQLKLSWTNWGSCGEKSYNGLRSVRVAESAPDPATALARTGRFVTHGIYFDTNSDVLKPESAPVIKEISDALYKNQDMKLEINGYTDSTGSAAHNVDLSKRRAEAVMNVLVSQFGIDRSRLTANGFGAAHPIASNNSARGRAQNRRVEFIKK